MEENISTEAKENKTNYLQLIFLVLLFIAIACLIVAIKTIYNYSDMLKNPLGQNMKNFGMDYCECQNNKGQLVQISAIGSNYTKTINISNYVSCSQYSPIDINKLNLTPQ